MIVKFGLDFKGESGRDEGNLRTRQSPLPATMGSSMIGCSGHGCKFISRVE